MKKRLGLVASLLLCTAASADATYATSTYATCTLGSTVLEEVSRFCARGVEFGHARQDR